MVRNAILALDLGKHHDHAAGTILYKLPRHYNPIAERYGLEQYGPWDERWRCPAIRRWPQGTDYTEVADYALTAPAEANVGTIVVEYNGVGSPVVDYMYKEAQRKNVGELKIVPVLSMGSNVRAHTNDDPKGRFKVHVVPKIDLVAAASILAEKSLLAFSSEVKEVKLLFEEMRLFRMKYTASANVQFGNQPGVGNHDDLVISFCLACWWAQRMRTFNFYAG